MKKLALKELSADLRELYDAALAAREQAYIPYSHFAVGAAVRCASGAVYGGCNVENASYGLCVCGERNAIFHAWAQASASLRRCAYWPTRRSLFLLAVLAVK